MRASAEAGHGDTQAGLAESGVLHWNSSEFLSDQRAGFRQERQRPRLPMIILTTR